MLQSEGEGRWKKERRKKGLRKEFEALDHVGEATDQFLNVVATFRNDRAHLGHLARSVD